MADSMKFTIYRPYCLEFEVRRLPGHEGLVGEYDELHSIFLNAPQDSVLTNAMPDATHQGRLRVLPHVHGGHWTLYAAVPKDISPDDLLKQIDEVLRKQGWQVIGAEEL